MIGYSKSASNQVCAKFKGRKKQIKWDLLRLKEEESEVEKGREKSQFT